MNIVKINMFEALLMKNYIDYKILYLFNMIRVMCSQ